MATYTKLKRLTKAGKDDLKDGQIITKMYDMGDAGAMKKFSLCNISYKSNGLGFTPITAVFKIDGNPTWKDFLKKKGDNYSVSAFTSPYVNLKKTNGSFRTASLKFPDKSIGNTVQIKLYMKNGTIYKFNTYDKFELSDIGFTYRVINRK